MKDMAKDKQKIKVKIKHDHFLDEIGQLIIHLYNDWTVSRLKTEFLLTKQNIKIAFQKIMDRFVMIVILS